MRRSASNRRPRAARLWRAVALFFLAFTAYDIALPGTCAEEILGLPPGIFERRNPDCADAALADEHVAMSSAHDHAGEENPGETGCAPEDCFCCCAHLDVPGAFRVAPAARPGAQYADLALSLPDTPPDAQFRPPRTA